MDERTMTPGGRPGRVSIVLGLWLSVSPFLLSFAEISTATWNNVAIGAVVGIIGFIRVSSLQQPEWSWTNVVLGIWLISSPFVLGFLDQVPLWNNILLGIIIALVGWANATTKAPAVT